jgi:hypothetical protein
MPKFILFILLLLFCCGVKAQTWEFGLGAGGAGYMGDLNASNPIKVSGPSASLFVVRNFDGYFSIRGSYTAGIISAADSNSSSQQFRNRNLSFTTTLSEVSVVGQFNFLDYIPEVGRNKFTPYLYFGFAAVNYNPTTVYQGVKYDLRAAETEGEKKPYSTMAFSFPYGVGFKYNIVGAFTLGAEIGYRNPNTDYLDDVSGNYPAKSLSHNTVAGGLSDPSGEKTGVYIGSPGSQRGDGNPRDTYFFTQITLSFTFISQKCYFH